MSKDKVYEKQLEQFGVEQTRVIDVDLRKRAKEEHAISSSVTIKNIMDTMQGRQWMYSKLDSTGVFTTPFVPGQPDFSAFLSGAQAVGQMFLSEVMLHTPKEFNLMCEEAAARTAVLKGKRKEEPLV